MTATGVDGRQGPLRSSRVGDLRGDRAAHVDRDRRAGEREAGPVGQRLAVGIMAGGEDQARGLAAKRQRNFGLGGGGEARR